MSKKSGDVDYKPSVESQEQAWASSDEDVFKPKKPRKVPKIQKVPKKRVSKEGDNDLKPDRTHATQSMGFCPLCQVPLNILKISPMMHTASCNMTGYVPDCPDGVHCLSPIIFHYRDFNHGVLARFRASEDYEEPDVVFTPQKLKRTPLKKLSGKKRPAKSPLTSTSKLKKTEEEPCCSKDPQKQVVEENKGSKDLKKKLFFQTEDKCSDDTVAGSIQSSLPESLEMSELWVSDLLLEGSIPVEDNRSDSIEFVTPGGSIPEEENIPDPIEVLAPGGSPEEENIPDPIEFLAPGGSPEEENIPDPLETVIFKQEPLSQNCLQNDDVQTAVSNATLSINYNNVLSDTTVDEQTVERCNVECSQNCREKGTEVQDTLQVNCSVIFRANGLNRDEAMALSPVSVTLMVNKSGWEAVEVKGSESIDVSKIKVSLCDCSHMVHIDCSVTTDINDVKFNPHKTEQFEKFFATMADLGLKRKDLLVQPVEYGMTGKKDFLDKRCNKITVSSLDASNITVPGIEEPHSCALPSSEKEIQPANKILDAFSLLKKTKISNNQGSVTLPAPSKPSSKKPRSSFNVPMVVSNTTGSSWTLEQGPQRGAPSKNGGKKIPGYKRIPGTQILVDAFNYGIVPGVKAYFLSHFHYDHYIGLRKGFSKPIFCSQVTANLVYLRLKVDQENLHILKIGEPRVVCGVEVEIFEANHCPGAVMFLFRLLDGQTFLHVGDFRAHKSMEVYPQLRFVDKLFLDTTYCDPAYDFPSQEEVVSKVVQTVSQHLAQHKSTLIVCGTYTIGKEKVFMGIADAFNMKIWTSTEKRKIYNCLEDRALSSRLTTDPKAAQIHVVVMKEIASQELLNHLDKFSPNFSHLLAFKPTGWSTSTDLKSKPGDFVKNTRGKVTIYGVPYSEHSSFSELRQFVRHIRPKDIQVTVNLGNSSHYKKLFEQWLKSNRNDDGQSKMVQYLTSSFREPSR